MPKVPKKKVEEVVEEETEMIECPECDGAGEVNCLACGSVTDCGNCDGTGEVEDE